jgi:hypothetical protein
MRRIHALRAVLVRVAVPALAALLLLTPAVPAAQRTVRFQDREVSVPKGWPVIRLAKHPRTCVRLDRRAVYLGRPGAEQRCPADAALGPRRAILVSSAKPARGGARDRAGVPTIGDNGRTGDRVGAGPRARASATGGAGTAPAQPPAASGYVGLGFDACAAPSSRTMAAWGASPYRAIGVYIGGRNRACAQPNLTAAWVGEQVAAGWQLIPTYVGLQAPTSACGSCAKLSPTLATAQGRAAARDAVAEARAVAIGPGSPIYFDMEAYTRTARATRATLTFLAAWTEEMHALGYLSGVYSSSSSGIADIADQVGRDYALPDDLWIANWNGQRNTRDPNVPADAWPGRRIHQYRGGHNETWGGVTINIDNDYVEGSTVGNATPRRPPLLVRHARGAAASARVWVRCRRPEGAACPGRLLLRTHVKVPVRGRRGRRRGKTRAVRMGIGGRPFTLAGGRGHTFRVPVDSRGRPLLRRSRSIRVQLLVATPGGRAVRRLRLARAR